MIDVFYHSPRGASIGRSFPDESALLAFISRLHKPAVILVKGVHIGKVFKTESGWGWFYDPEMMVASAATSVEQAARVLGHIRTPHKAKTSAANGRSPVKPGSRPRGRPRKS